MNFFQTLFLSIFLGAGDESGAFTYLWSICSSLFFPAWYWLQIFKKKKENITYYLYTFPLSLLKILLSWNRQSLWVASLSSAWNWSLHLRKELLWKQTVKPVSLSSKAEARTGAGADVGGCAGKAVLCVAASIHWTPSAMWTLVSLVDFIGLDYMQHLSEPISTYLPLSLLDLQCGRLYVIRICCVGKSIINKIT